MVVGGDERALRVRSGWQRNLCSQPIQVRGTSYVVYSRIKPFGSGGVVALTFRQVLR